MTMPMDDFSGHLPTWWAEIASAGVVLGSMLDYLPKVCAVIGAVYWLLLIFDWFEQRRRRYRRQRRGSDDT